MIIIIIILMEGWGRNTKGKDVDTQCRSSPDLQKLDT